VTRHGAESFIEGGSKLTDSLAVGSFENLTA
jgi:hypothetical protein